MHFIAARINPNFTPVVPTIASMGPNVWEGVYTFNYNGKGKMEARQCYQNGPNTYDSGCALLSWEFKYEMDGTEITFKFIPRTYSLEYIAGPNTIYPKLTPTNPNCYLTNHGRDVYHQMAKTYPYSMEGHLKSKLKILVLR